MARTIDGTHDLTFLTFLPFLFFDVAASYIAINFIDITSAIVG